MLVKGLQSLEDAVIAAEYGLALGKQLGVPTPVLSVIYAALKLHANGAPE